MLVVATSRGHHAAPTTAAAASAAAAAPANTVAVAAAAAVTDASVPATAVLSRVWHLCQRLVARVGFRAAPRGGRRRDQVGTVATAE